MNKQRSINVYYSDYCQVEMPTGHRFPMHKYELLRAYLQQHNIVQMSQMFPAPLVTPDVVLKVHERGYVHRFLKGELTQKEARRIGIPWSESFRARTMASVGATVSALHSALQLGISGALSGGTHHANIDSGGGFCVFNDLAIAARVFLEMYPEGNVLIVDLDVHQGDGTAEIFHSEDRVYTFSMHGGANYPFNKVHSDRDVGLARHTKDELYLDLLEQELRLLSKLSVDVVLYQAGVDGLTSDKLGTLDLSHAGLEQRDCMVFEFARSRDIPLVITMGGGYAEPIEDSIVAYANTYRVVNQVYA